MPKGLPLRNVREKEFAGIFQKLCYSKSSWEVWSDFCEMFAITLSNAVGNLHKETREKQYLAISSRYTALELDLFAQMFSALVMALEENPQQDFLGELFMRLELGNHWKGQFFTPYHLCHAIGMMQCTDVVARVDEQGWISAYDCACGAGALLIAFAHACRESGVNYQDHVLFVAQDIDRVAGFMCYIQMSLQGMPGYVVIRDTLSKPLTGNTLFAPETEDTWATPFYFKDTWAWRRMLAISTGNEEAAK